MEKAPDGHDFWILYEGDYFHLTPDNTVLCTYDNDIADHVLHYLDDEGNVLFFSRHDDDGLFDALFLREFRVVHEHVAEDYVKDFLGRLAIASCEHIAEENS